MWLVYYTKYSTEMANFLSNSDYYDTENHHYYNNFNFSAEIPNRKGFFTSRVISRIKSNLVQTKSGPYCLDGKMNFELALSYGAPQFILSAFKIGFPENWEMYREQWRKFTKQQRGKKINDKNVRA